MNDLIYHLLISLILTILIETTAAFVTGIRDRSGLLLVVLVNVLTNPVVVLSYYIGRIFIVRNLWCLVLILEGAAIITEGYCYQRYLERCRHPWIFSVGLNMVSYLIGLIL